MAQKDPYYVARGRVAATSPNGIHPDADKHHTAKQEFALAKIERFIHKALSEAPPLTKEQKQRLSRLLTVEGGESR